MDARSLAYPGYYSRPDHEKLHQEHLKAVRTFEDEHGRRMLPSELDRFSREFYASYYRAVLRRLAALGVADEEDLKLSPFFCAPQLPRRAYLKSNHADRPRSRRALAREFVSQF